MIDVSRGDYWDTGIRVTVLTIAAILICEDNFEQFWHCSLNLLRFIPVKISSLKVYSYTL